MSTTIQPTQAAHVKVGDTIHGSLIDAVVTDITEGAFGYLYFTLERVDARETDQPMVRSFAKTSMLSVVVK